MTKLFGVNYDTPTSGEPIHASSSQLSAPGSYMLAPSYSEALLMDPSPQPIDRRSSEDAVLLADPSCADIVPSYSEALLYERAQQIPSSVTSGCDCYCHAQSQDEQYAEVDAATAGPQDGPAGPSTSGRKTHEHEYGSSSSSSSSSSACQRCRSGNYTNASRPSIELQDHRRAGCQHAAVDNFRRNSLETCSGTVRDQNGSHLTRDLSAPNFQTQSEFAANTQFLRHNGNSLENILENDELAECGTSNPLRTTSRRGDLGLAKKMTGCGAIPKNRPMSSTSGSLESASPMTGSSYRLIENPLDGRRAARSEDDDSERNISGSKTYFCLKSILKQHKRRYTLVTAEELRKLASDEVGYESSLADKNARAPRENRRTHQLFNRDNFFWRSKDAATTSGQSAAGFADQRVRRVASSR